MKVISLIKLEQRKIMCIGFQFLDQDSREENPNKASISKFESLAANIEM